jgi:hypothetical protein
MRYFKVYKEFDMTDKFTANQQGVEASSMLDVLRQFSWENLAILGVFAVVCLAIWRCTAVNSSQVISGTTISKNGKLYQENNPSFWRRSKQTINEDTKIGVGATLYQRPQKK